MATITQKVVRRGRRKYGLTIYDHKGWGSKAQAVYAARRKNRPVRVKKADTVAQHITVTRRSGDLKADARTVERIGLDRFGSGVSYNFLVDMKTGEIAVGQPLDAKGTHTVNNKGVKGFSYDQNHAARAIAVVGMPEDTLSDKAAAAISGLLAAMQDVGAITTTFDYKPHSFFTAKDCPCTPTRGQMDRIRKASVALRQKPGKHKAEKPKKPTRVSRSQESLDDLDALLTDAVEKGGRKGAVRKFRDALRRERKTLPKR